MKKLGQHLIQIFLVLFSIIFTYIIGIVLFYKRRIFEIPVTPLVMILLTILLIGFLYFLYYALQKYSSKWNMKIVFTIFFIIFVIIQSIVAYQLAVNPAWDFGTVFKAAIDDVNHVLPISQNEYFYQFQNNVALAYMLNYFFLIFKFFGCTNYLLAGVIFNIICIDIAIFFLYKMITLMFTKEKQLFFLLLLFTTLPFITLTPIFYTDTIALPFVTIPLFLLLYIMKHPDCSKKKEYLLYGLCGFIFGIGMQVKFTVVIVLIAFIGYRILSTDIRKKWKSFLILLLGILLVVLPVKLVSKRLFNQERLYQTQVPMTHWIMMGLHKDGDFSYEEYRTTFEAGDYDAKVHKNIGIIKKRVIDYISTGKFVPFYTKKLSIVWSDGSYYAPELVRIDPVRDSILHDFVLANGKHFVYFYSFSQMQHITMLVMILLSILCAKNWTVEQKNIRNFLLVIIFGLICFFLLWEVSPRYILHMLPVLIIASYIGMDSVFTFINQKLHSRIEVKNE